MYGTLKNAITILIARREESSALETTYHRWDVIEMAVKVVGFMQLRIAPLVLTLDAGLLARSQYPEGPVNGHLDTGFSWFPCVYKRMLR